MEMIRKETIWKDLGVTARMSLFPGDEVQEMHVILRVQPCAQSFEKQLERLLKAFRLFTAEHAAFKAVLKRYFLSDSTNQQPHMPKEQGCAVSYIQQPPLDGSKIALWCYLTSGMNVTMENGACIARHGGYSHYFQAGLTHPSGDSYHQTQQILKRYEQGLEQNSMMLSANCMRTWFFIRDVDTHYAGMVKARKENFQEQGLTEKTHYIASTGIGGSPAHVNSLVQMDAYAVDGLAPLQFHHLYAPTHLNSTYEYGVTFERGTAVDYGDRSHLYISGTASIDSKGQVLHLGDVQKQCERMWENVETLLKEGGASFDDVTHQLVYLRDMADFPIIEEMFQKRFPTHPVVFTLAPVCRPAWLIEMECEAIVPKKTHFKPY